MSLSKIRSTLTPRRRHFQLPLPKSSYPKMRAMLYQYSSILTMSLWTTILSLVEATSQPDIDSSRPFFSSSPRGFRRRRLGR